MLLLFCFSDICVYLCVFVYKFIFNVSEKHSLYYIYSALNKDVSLPGIYEFTALGLLDDREIDYYNMQEDYWGKGTSLAASEQWFKVNVEILMQRMNHNLHVLQWRHGCEIDESNGTVTFLRGIDQYSYDGSDFLSFDNSNKVWVAPVQAAEETKRKWDNVGILNQYTQGYLEKECGPLCVNPPLEMNKCVLFSNPDVHVFTKKSVYDPKKLILTCLATGFYPKDVELNLRNFSISIPEHLITSSGVRPNDDGTYQLRKSVEISGDDPADYYCYVNHSSFKKPLIKKGGNYNCVIVIMLIFLAVLCIILKKTGFIGEYKRLYCIIFMNLHRIGAVHKKY
uniref:Ig-like domain-containing protein n=1 Tax=Astyanax mexicanus TaxID=7994 RepID=A0A3B1K6M2_ASTMX